MAIRHYHCRRRNRQKEERPAYRPKENGNRKTEREGEGGEGRTVAQDRETRGRDTAAEKYNLLDHERARAAIGTRRERTGDARGVGEKERIEP